MTEHRRHWGKYRGIVCHVHDPQQLGRIQALVPGVHGHNPTTWALPCFAFVGAQQGIVALPAIGANVWIEYEDGHIDHPIWTGGFWLQPAEVPTQAPPAGLQPSVTLQTPTQSAIILSDDPTIGITLKTAAGAQIAITSNGITITNGQGATITLSGPSVDINQGALKVT
jgi:uncharacterized protein involved in type VI secretion and phage assembly